MGDAGGIALAGFMGAGKSTIGASLARAVRLPFVDLDVRIEHVTGRSVPEIFQAVGEAGFRLLEAEVLGSVCSGEPVVLALGGGTLHQPGNLERVRGALSVFVLELPWDVLQRRVDNGAGRPLAAEAEVLFSARQAGYLTAGVVVDGDRTVDEIVQQIEILWRAG